MSEESVINNPNTGRPYEYWVLSVDFGTSSTVVVAAYGQGPDALQHQVLEFQGERRVPSVVLVDDDGSLVVGHAASHLAASRPDRVIRTPKRRLGDQRPVILGGQANQPVDLASAILAHVAANAIDQFGSPPNEVRLTHPVTWNRPLQQRLLEAAAKAGLTNVVLIPEPVAAAMSLGPAAVPVGASLAIYDLGGGTFDTTVVRSIDAGFDVLGDPIGDPTIGGELFDEMLMNMVGARLDPDLWESLQVSDDATWRQSAARMLAECQRVKEALSLHDYAEVVVSHPLGVTTERVTRAEFEELIASYIDESVRLTKWSVVEAGVQDSLSAVRLIGGSSRMPIVARSLGAAFPGVAVQVDHDPRTAVALGASLATAAVNNTEAARPVGTTIDETPIAPGPTPPVTPASQSAAPSTHVVPPRSNPPSHAAPAQASPQQASPTRPPEPLTVPAETPGMVHAPATVHAQATVVGSVPETRFLRSMIDTRSPALLVGAGMLAVFVLAGALFALWSGGADDDTVAGPNTTLGSSSSGTDDGGGGTISTFPTTAPATIPTTSTPPTSTPTDPATTAVGGLTAERLQATLLTDGDVGSDWTARTYSAADDASEFCQLEPVAVPTKEEGRVWDRDLLSLSSILYEYSTEQEAIDVIAQDRTLAADCPTSTQLIEGIEFTVAVAQPDVLPDQLTFGDEVAAASFVLLSNDLDITLYVFTFEQRRGRTISQTAFISTAPFEDVETQEYITHTLTAFQRHIELPR